MPWLAFLLLGLLIARLRLSERSTQAGLLWVGASVFLLTTIVSSLLMSVVERVDPEATILFSTSPIPPFLLYMIAGGSAACAVIGACLLLEPFLERVCFLAIVTPAGRQTLTLYIAHILIGMGTLEAIGWLGNSTPTQAYFAALVFCVLATLFAALWARFFQRGLVETLMRKIAG